MLTTFIAVSTKRLTAAVFAARMRHIRDRLARRMMPELDVFFVGQAARAVTRLTGEKAFFQKQRPPGELLPPEEDALLWKTLAPFIEQAILDSGALAASLVGGQGPTLSDPRVLAQIAQAGTRIRRINEATRQAVRDMLTVAHERGYNTYQVARGVPAEGFRGLREVVEETYLNRSEAIARTEMAEASLEAAHSEWKDAGVGELEIIDGGGATSCEECDARSGEIVSISEGVELLHPNCTVVTLPVLERVA